MESKSFTVTKTYNNGVRWDFQIHQSMGASGLDHSFAVDVPYLCLNETPGTEVFAEWEFYLQDGEFWEPDWAEDPEIYDYSRTLKKAPVMFHRRGGSGLVYARVTFDHIRFLPAAHGHTFSVEVRLWVRMPSPQVPRLWITDQVFENDFLKVTFEPIDKLRDERIRMAEADPQSEADLYPPPNCHRYGGTDGVGHPNGGDVDLGPCRRRRR